MGHNPLIPMGAITGRPGREELRRNLENYRKSGIDQFLIYPRSGLEVEYMGPEWLEICRHIIEYCAEHDMAVWLYDEYNWPSGKCKGKVTKGSPDFMGKKLVAFVDRNFCGLEDPDAPGQDYYWTEVPIPMFADIQNPKAVDYFIELTHETYYKHFGKYFGTVIKGIFSDEPSFIYPVRGQTMTGCTLEIPYYTGLKEDYREATGRELINDLEAYLAGNKPNGLWENYYTLQGKRFKSVFMDKIRQWCDDHGVLFTGHLLYESPTDISLTANGLPVEIMRSFSMPGIDEIPSHSIFEDIEWETLKLIESSINGPRQHGLVELFALGPADMTLAKMREMIYLCAAHGIDHYVTAVSALDARGNVEKGMYYNPVAPTQPWYRYAGTLNESAAVAAGLCTKASTADIAIRYPQSLYAKHWRHKNPASQKIELLSLIKALHNAQWEFRIIGEDEAVNDAYSTVLCLTENGVTEEKSNTELVNIQELLVLLEKTSKRRAQLRYSDGSPVERIMLKTYDDGTTLIINTSNEYLRGVTLGEETFDMPPCDIAILPRPVPSKAENFLNLTTADFIADIEQNNTLRCIFPASKEITVEVTEDTEVQIALRQYYQKADVMLDNKPVCATEKCELLPDGQTQLFNQSQKFTLSKGKHIIRQTNNSEDFSYLPLAFICGRFALGSDKVIRPLPENAMQPEILFNSCLKEYAGTVVLRKQVDLSNTDAIAFEYKNMAVELIVDGKSLGPCLWAPFEWEIPTDMQHTNAEVNIRIATSVGPLFADYPEHQLEEMKNALNTWWPGVREL